MNGHGPLDVSKILEGLTDHRRGRHGLPRQGVALAAALPLPRHRARCSWWCARRGRRTPRPASGPTSPRASPSRRCREAPGRAYEEFLREKIHVVDADVSKPLCGFSNELRKEIEGTIDAVVNVAGVVDFNPPLDEALLTNARGMQNLVELAKALGDVPVLHTSTCYVAGYRRAHPRGGRPARPLPALQGDARREVGPAREIVRGPRRSPRASTKHADDATASRSTSRRARPTWRRRRSPPPGRSSPPR
jgi:hypothetical protein